MPKRRNYQRELDQLISSLSPDAPKPRLLLHVCCAPCSSYVLEYLAEIFEITVFYYNPNITPESEYKKRILELQRLILEAGYTDKVHFTEGAYEPALFFEMARGLRNAVGRGRQGCEKYGSRLLYHHPLHQSPQKCRVDQRNRRADGRPLWSQPPAFGLQKKERISPLYRTIKKI